MVIMAGHCDCYSLLSRVASCNLIVFSERSDHNANFTDEYNPMLIACEPESTLFVFSIIYLFTLKPLTWYRISFENADCHIAWYNVQNEQNEQDEREI